MRTVCVSALQCPTKFQAADTRLVTHLGKEGVCSGVGLVALLVEGVEEGVEGGEGGEGGRGSRLHAQYSPVHGNGDA
jgi:hypothetical protein